MENYTVYVLVNKHIYNLKIIFRSSIHNIIQYINIFYYYKCTLIKSAMGCGRGDKATAKRLLSIYNNIQYLSNPFYVLFT